MLTSIASAEGWSFSYGEEVMVDDNTCDAWLKAGIAEKIEEEGVTDGSPQVDNTTGKRTNKSK